MDTIRMMTGIKQQAVIFIFLLIVILPAVILSFFAVRAVNQEEMVQKRQLEDTLLLELDKTNTILRLTINNIIQELHESVPDFRDTDYEKKIKIWKDNQSLAGIPYILSDERSIIYPDINSKNTDDKKTADLFHWRYLNLFSNSESIPVYKNIASEYEKEILGKSTTSEYVFEEKSAAAEIKADTYSSAQNLSDNQKTERTALPSRKTADTQLKKESTQLLSIESPDSDIKGFEDAEESESLSQGIAAFNEEVPENSEIINSETGISSLSAPKKSALRSKKALELFESDTAIQEKIYTKAEEEGQQYLTRNLLPQVTERTEIPQTVIRSVYIESSRYFNEITEDSDYGIIPRTFDSTFILLFWEKKGDIITGCEINMNEFNRRLTEASGDGENSFRYINIIDRSGIPLIAFNDIEAGRWRKPFVAKEISELLPYWETAILLRNPEEVEKQIESSKYIMSLIVFFLCMMIFTGITAVYRFSSTRLKNVQQRVGFVTNVTHELKTPLTSIRMYSEMMAEGYQKDQDKIQKYSSYIASESQRLTRLINNVLDFAKLEKGTKIFNPEHSDVNKIIENMVPPFKEDFEKNGFTFILELSTGSLNAVCDREEIIQVLINLFSNVRKYSHDEKYIRISSGSEGRNIFIKIEDRGRGIHRKYRKKIFSDFFRIDTSITSDSKGTGLGLAIAKKIMKQHKGDLLYSPVSNNNYRQGSIFSIVLPKAEI